MYEAVLNAVNVGLHGFFIIAGLLTLASIMDSGIRAVIQIQRLRKLRKTALGRYDRNSGNRLVVPYALGKRRISVPDASDKAQSSLKTKRRA